MQRNPQRPLNTAHTAYNLARDGAAKRLTDPAIVHGQTRATVGNLAPYHHGVSVDDTPNVPFKTYEQKIPVHPGMTDKQKAAHDPKLGEAVLTEAANLGRKPGSVKA